MPIVDRRAFGGRFTVKENPQQLANYRFEGFYGQPVESEPHFTFLKAGHGEPAGSPSAIIGE
jgi:hypothetical protein